MPQAIWNGKRIAQARTEDTRLMEGNVYFPPSAVDPGCLQPSKTHTVCAWKGTASYYDVVVDGQVNKDAAWVYPETTEAARPIQGYIAFWKGVAVLP